MVHFEEKLGEVKMISTTDTNKDFFQEKLQKSTAKNNCENRLETGSKICRHIHNKFGSSSGLPIES